MSYLNFQTPSKILIKQKELPQTPLTQYVDRIFTIRDPILCITDVLLQPFSKYLTFTAPSDPITLSYYMDGRPLLLSWNTEPRLYCNSMDGSLTVEYSKKYSQVAQNLLFLCQFICFYICYFMLLCDIIGRGGMIYESSHNKI